MDKSLPGDFSFGLKNGKKKTPINSVKVRIRCSCTSSLLFICSSALHSEHHTHKHRLFLSITFSPTVRSTHSHFSTTTHTVISADTERKAKGKHSPSPWWFSKRHRPWDCLSITDSFLFLHISFSSPIRPSAQVRRTGGVGDSKDK